MGRHVFEHIPLPAEIFHELAGQLHRVPLHAADARDIALVDLGQHVVQAVAELMEQRGHVVMRQQGRFSDAVDFHPIREIAHQMRHRGLQLARVGAQPAVAHVVHPGTAALAGAGGRVQVKLAHQGGCGRGACSRTVSRCGGALNPVKLYAGLPHGCRVGANRHIKQRLDDFEQAGQDLGRGEVLLDLLLAEGVTGFLELFAGIRQIPIFQLGHAQVLCRKLAQVSQVFDCERLRLGAQIAQKTDDLIR